MEKRITKADLEVGDIVKDKYGSTVKVSSLSRLEGSNAPVIGPGDFGYTRNLDADVENHVIVGGVCAVRNVVEIIKDD